MAQSGKVKIPVQIGSESHPPGSRTGLVSTNGFGKINRRLFSAQKEQEKGGKKEIRREDGEEEENVKGRKLRFSIRSGESEKKRKRRTN